MFGKKKKKAKENVFSVIIAAGGSSRRMITENKLLAEIGGIPVLARTLMAFEANENISEIVIAARSDMIITYAELAKAFEISKVRHVIVGGVTRAESVYRGVCAVSPLSTHVLVHDAARPLVSQGVINRVISALEDNICATAAVDAKDTIRAYDESAGAYKVVPRDTVKVIQTPQGFDRQLLIAALLSCIENGTQVTDDCSAAELLGAKTVLTEGSYQNIKITTEEDLFIADGLLAEEI